MSGQGQQIANIEPAGEITKQQQSQSESSQSYAIPGGQAHEQSRDASRLMEANIAGGQMKQQTQEHQFAKQAEAVQETPGGVQRTSEAAAAQQQVSQSVSNQQTQGADGSISTRRVTSKRTVQQSSSVKQSHISSQTSAHPAQGMIQAPVPSELQIQNLATQQNAQRQQVAHQQQQLAQQTQLPDLPADSDMTSVSRTKHTQHSHKQVTQTSQKVTSATQQQTQQQQLVQGTAHQKALNMPTGGQPAPPVFEQIFRNARFAQGGNALFEGRVRGNPRPTISWTRQGRPIYDSNKYQLKYDQASGEVSLMISRIGPGDEGEYTCLAKNQYGEAICTVYIQPEAAYLQQQQQQQQMQQQHQHLQQQQYQHQQVQQHQQQFHQQQFHQQQHFQQQQFQQSSMQQQSMQRRMMGQQQTMQYHQQAMSTTDSAASSSVQQQYQDAALPAPYGQPSVQQQTEEFRVDTFEYRLIRETEFRESLTRRYAGETETETEVETESESRQPGPLSPPQVQTKPRATKVSQNGDATFQARLVGNPKPKVTWFHNGVRVRPSTRAAASHSNSNAVLRLRSVQPQDSGHYTMLAENAAGCVVSSAFLAVEPAADTTRQQTVTSTQRTGFSEETTTTEDRSLAPTFLRVPTDKETQEGKMVRLECRTSGKPSPEVFWYINGLPIVNDATHKIMVNEAGSHALMITNATQRDSGVVTCVAKNKNGQTQFQVNLNVLEREQVIAPKFVERFQTVHVRPGEPVSLSCRAVGAPTPRISWQKDGAPIDSSANVRIVTDGGASMLDIPCVSPEDGAWYQCTAQNAAGSTATRAKLYVDTGPAPPAGEPWRLHLPKPTRVIEPEPPQESEIIHLRHVERSRPKPQRQEEDRPVQPPQFTHPLRDVAVSEGDRILLEAKLVPLGDPTMRIEWYIDGHPLPASSRATLTDKFGYVSLSLLSVIRQDAGTYTCRAINQAGSADTTCTVVVGPRSTIETVSQHPESLQPIQQLEDNSRYVLKSASMEMTSMRPTFIHELRDVTGLAEGSYAHFEAQINPVSDPFMRIEWFKDGKPITASSRISTINNFGYLALNINQLRPEDSGVYTVRATNKAGDATSQASLSVSVPDPGVTGDLGIPEQQRYIQSVEQLEAYKQSIYQQVTSELEEKTVPPNFTQPIRDAPAVPENGTAHFEARLEPMGDSTMTIHWFKDNKPLEASSRMTTFFNFGYVSLTIKQVSVFDTGSYTCVARNAAGQTQCQARLQCVGRQDVLQESHMESMTKIQYLEDSSRYQRTEEEDVTVTKMPPKFLGPIKGTTIIREDQKAHFEARLEPQNDPTMKTEWFHNGQPLTSANRIQTFLNFGYVALDISAVKPEDAGTYTLVATNALGREQQQTQMRVEARSAIDTTSIHRTVVDKTDRLERSKFQEPRYDVGDYCKSKPHFTEPLRDPAPQAEGRGVHLECRLEPLNDPTMKVEWFLNGKPITIGHRFRTYCDFGFVALDILDLTTTDAGEYTVRATNQLGSAHTSAMVRVSSHAHIDTETQHEAALDQIQYLESGSRLTRQMTTDTSIEQAPTFTKPLRNIETAEGTNVHLECRLQPVGDNSMRVEWFVNDQPLKVGHRFRPAYDFDYVALDLLSVYPTDSGMYTCRATNRLGQAVTSAAVRVIAKKDMYTNHPASLEQIQYIEDSSRYQRKEWADEMVQIKPKFTTQLKHQESLREGQTAHFEAKLEPVADANLHVEWLRDGKPITVGHRHRPLHDFGYVALDIVGLIEEDNGVYTCRATNNQGVDETSAILRCSREGSTKILTTSQHETGLERVTMLEDRSRLTRSETLEEVTTQAPVFTTSLSSVSIKEGQRAHFESRLIPVSDPTMKVQWFHNGRPVKAGSRFMETNSFGFVALDIMYAYPEDQGTYTCKATNALGEAVTQATLSCTTKSAIDQGSLHEQALDKLRYLEMKSRPVHEAEEGTAQAPVFTQPVRDVRLVEGQPLHFEARLIPVGDANLKVEWFKNGVPLQQANRISTLHDFGFVALDMKYTQEEDSGTYTCRATNDLGQAATSATAVIQSKDSLLMETQNASSLEKLRMLEGRAFTRTEIEETVVTEKPRFVTELTGPTSLVEGQSAHMEARIEPYPDPDMKVEWFHNGMAVGTGHRFRTVNDFGFIALDVLSAYPEDSGQYTAKITNRLGTATSTININIQARASLIQETQHPAAMQKISYLESDRRREVHEEAASLEKPVFGRPLRNAALAEGQSAHLEATLTPVNDATMKVEWFYNGRPIPQGHRFRTTYDFGYVALDILYTYPEDSGTYMCKATNAAGEAVTTCQVTVEGKPESPPVWKSVRNTVDAIEGRESVGVGVSDVIREERVEGDVNGFEGMSRSQCLSSDMSEVTRDVTDAKTEQRTSSTTTNAYSSSSSANDFQHHQQQQRSDEQHANASTGVYYPFYNAECTYVERAKMPVPEKKTVESSETKKSSISKTSSMKSSSDFFTTTWDDDQPFPVPVAFNMRDLSLDQFKTMNEFFSGSTPDYFDKKDTKSHESQSKTWKEGNTEYHTSMTKTEITSFTTSKKTIVTDVPSKGSAPVQVPTAPDTSNSSHTRESKFYSQKTERHVPVERPSRSMVRMRDIEGAKTRSQSLQKSSSQTMTSRSHSVDGKVVTIQTDSAEKAPGISSVVKPSTIPAFDKQFKTTETKDSKFMKVGYKEQQRQPPSIWKPVVPQLPKAEVPIPAQEKVTKKETSDDLFKNTTTTKTTTTTENKILELDTKQTPTAKPFKRTRSRSVEHIVSPDEVPVVRQQRRHRSARRSEPYVTPLVKLQAPSTTRPLRKTSPSPVRSGPKPFTPAVYSNVVDESVIKTSKDSDWSAKEVLRPVVFQPPPPKTTDVFTFQDKVMNESYSNTTNVIEDTFEKQTHSQDTFKPLPAVVKPRDDEATARHQFSTIEMKESKTYTTKTQQETPPISRPVPIKPMWQEPVQTPKAAQTEQQKRMEQKFIKKVTERKESTELPIVLKPEPAPIYEAPPQPRPLPKAVPEQLDAITKPVEVDDQQFYSRNICGSKTFTTTTQETTSPPAEPATAVWHEPTPPAPLPQTDQQKRMEQKFMKKVTERKESTELPIVQKPEPAPIYEVPPMPRPLPETVTDQVDISKPAEVVDQQFYSRKVCESKTFTTTTQQEMTSPPTEPATAVWHKPVPPAPLPQTEQQKRMEQKFIKKVTERKESKELPIEPTPEPAPIYEVPPHPRPLPEAVPEQLDISQTAKAIDQQFYSRKVCESKTFTSTTEQETTSPPAEPATAVWHEPTPPAPLPQTEQQKRMEQKFIKKVTERKESTELPTVPKPEPAPIYEIPCPPRPVPEPVTEQPAEVIDHQFYTRKVCESKTVTTTQQETTSPPPELATAVWHEAKPPAQVPQIEKPKRMEQQFIKKVIQHQEAKEVPFRTIDVPDSSQPVPVVKPEPLTSEVSEEKKLFTQQTSQFSTHTQIIKQQETQPAPLATPIPVPVKPVWQEPVQTPKAAQTEQQKRMEQKFIKKVTERKESKELPIVPAPPEVVSVLPKDETGFKQEKEESTADHQFTSVTQTHKFQAMSFSSRQEETSAPAPEPIVPVWHEPAPTQTSDEVIGQQNITKDIQWKTESEVKVSKEVDDIPVPIYDVPHPVERVLPKPMENTKPKPFQPVTVDEQQTSSYEVDSAQTFALTTEQQDIPVVPAPVVMKPIWQEPVQPVKVGQTKQQKQMEEKFMKKVTEHKETSELEERVPEVPVPVPEIVPWEADLPSQPQEISEFKEYRTSHFEKTTSTHEVIPPAAPAEPITAVWHEPVQPPITQQTTKQKLMEDKFTKKIIEKESSDLKETPLPVVQPAPIYDTPRPIERPAAPIVKPVPFSTVDTGPAWPETKEQYSTFTKQFHESKTTTTTTQDTLPTKPEFVPIRYEREETQKMPQTEQQKRMEEKFLKKVTENKETKIIPEETSTPVSKPQIVPADQTDHTQSYIQEKQELQTYAFSQQTETPAKTIPEPIKPVWHEPVQTPKAAQTEQQKRMEEKFIKKVTTNKESKMSEKPEPTPTFESQPDMTHETSQLICTKEIREFKTSSFTRVEQQIESIPAPPERNEVPKYQPIAPLIVPLPEDRIEDEQFHISKQTDASKTITTTEQREQPPIPAPVPIKPVWHKPVQAPKAAQTEQQKRMEEKFMKKVTERKETKDIVDSQDAPVYDIPLPSLQPEPEEYDTVVDTTNSVYEQFTKYTSNEETVIPQRETKQEDDFFGKVEKNITTVKPPEKIPYIPSFETSHQVSEFKQELREVQTTYAPPQPPTTPTPKVKPVWVEPVEAPKAAQTAQQKRMEEKFMKKVTERKETKDQPDTSGPLPVPLHDDSFKMDSHEDLEESRETHTSQFHSWQDTAQTVESTYQPPSSVPMPTYLPPKPDTVLGKEKRQTRQVRERERKTSYHDTSMSDFSDSEATIKIKEIESKPLQLDVYEPYKNKYFIGPKIQEPPIYHKIHIEGQEEKKTENIYETVIPFPTPYKPVIDTQPATTTTEKASASSILENVLKHVTPPTAPPKDTFEETPYYPPYSEIHEEIVHTERSEVRSAPKPRSFTPTQFVPAPPAPAAPKAPETPAEAVPPAIKHVDSPKPTRKQAPRTPQDVEYPFTNDVPVAAFPPPKPVESLSKVTKTPVVERPKTQQKIKREEKLMKKYEDIAKKTKQTTREEEKRVFSPSPAPVERIDTSASNITKLSESKHFTSRTDKKEVPEVPKRTFKYTPSQTTSVVKNTFENNDQQTKSSEFTQAPAPIYRPPAESDQTTQLSQTFESTMTSQFSSSWQESTSASGAGPTAKPAFVPVPSQASHEHLTGSRAADESRKHEVIAKINSRQRDQARPVDVRPVSESRAPWQETTKRTERTESSRSVTEQTLTSGGAVSSTPRPAPRPVQPPVPPPRVESCDKRETSHLFSKKKTIADETRTPQRTMEVMPHQPQRMLPSMPEPYVDRQETFSSSKSNEKTATGHRQSESAEKRSHEVLHSVTNLPGSSTTRTMQQSSFQTMSQSFETSEQTFPAFPTPKAIEFPPMLTPEPFSDHWSSLDQSMSWHDMTDLSSSLDETIMQPSYQPTQTGSISEKSWKAFDEKHIGQTHSLNEKIIPIEMPSVTSRPAIKQATKFFEANKEQQHMETSSRLAENTRERIVPITPEPAYSSPSQPPFKTSGETEQNMTSDSFKRFETTQHTPKAPHEVVVPVQLTSQNVQKHSQSLAETTRSTQKSTSIQQKQSQQKWIDEQNQQKSYNQTYVPRPTVVPETQQKTQNIYQQSKFDKTTTSGHEHTIPVALSPARAPTVVQRQSDVGYRSNLNSSTKTSPSPFGSTPYVDKQETSSHSKSHDSTGGVTKDTESSERSMHSVQFTGPQTVAGPTPGSSVTQSSSEVRHEMSQSHTEQTSSCWPPSTAQPSRSALPSSSNQMRQTIFDTKSDRTDSRWGSQPAASKDIARTSQLESTKSTTEASRNDTSSRTDQVTRFPAADTSVGTGKGPKSESCYLEKRTKDGDNEHYQSLAYTKGGDVERIEEANKSIQREKENMNAKKVDNKTEVFETEEVRPDGRYRIQKKVETKTEEELMQSKHIETTTETLPAIGR